MKDFDEDKLIILTNLISKLVNYSFNKTESNSVILNIVEKMASKMSTVSSIPEKTKLALGLVMIYNKIKLYKKSKSDNQKTSDIIINKIIGVGNPIIVSLTLETFS